MPNCYIRKEIYNRIVRVSDDTLEFVNMACDKELKRIEAKRG